MPLHKQIQCYFSLIKCENPLHFHILSTKNNSVFVIFMFEIIMNRSLTNDVVNFEQLGPDGYLTRKELVKHVVNIFVVSCTAISSPPGV